MIIENSQETVLQIKNKRFFDSILAERLRTCPAMARYLASEPEKANSLMAPSPIDQRYIGLRVDLVLQVYIVKPSP
jgi:hypothetical protein